MRAGLRALNVEDSSRFMSKPDVDESTPMSYKHAKPTYLLVDGVSQRRLRCFGRPAHLLVVDAIGR
jgi:hypothetical protein